MRRDNKQACTCQVAKGSVKERKGRIRRQDAMGILFCRVVREDLRRWHGVEA